MTLLKFTVTLLSTMVVAVDLSLKQPVTSVTDFAAYVKK